MHDTSEQGRDSRHMGMGGMAVLAVPVILILYVLSIGPVGWFCENTSMGRRCIDTAEVLYAPILWLYQHTALEEPLRSYFKLWGWQ